MTPEEERAFVEKVRRKVALVAALRSAGLDDVANRVASGKGSAIVETPPRGKPGRRGYSTKALAYAQKLRSDNPRLTVKEIKRQCLDKFDRIDMPENEEAFRRWLNRKRKNRAN